jgi:hypothetical protein
MVIYQLFLLLHNLQINIKLKDINKQFKNSKHLTVFYLLFKTLIFLLNNLDIITVSYKEITVVQIFLLIINKQIK